MGKRRGIGSEIEKGIEQANGLDSVPRGGFRLPFHECGTGHRYDSRVRSATGLGHAENAIQGTKGVEELSDGQYMSIAAYEVDE